MVDDPAKGIAAASVVWEPEPVTTTADQALKAVDDQGAVSGTGSEAEELLRDMLADGPVAMKDIQAEAREAGFAWATVRRAKDRLGVVAERKSHGFGGKGEWLWRLADPHKMLIPPQGAHSQKVSTLCENEHLVDQEGGQGTPSDDHPPSQPNGKGAPDQPRTCAQCNAGGPPLHQLEGSDPPVWLHPACRRFWLKDHPTTNGARLAKYEPDFKVLARRYEEHFNSSRKGGCEGDKEGCDEWLRGRLSDVIPPALVEPAFDRVMQQVVFGQEGK